MDFYSHNFKVIREARGLTLQEIGSRFVPPIPKQTVQRWEAGIVKPPPKRLRKLAEILNCSVVDISDLPPENWLIEAELPQDGLLAYVISAWAKLTAEEKAEVVAVIERAKEKKTAAPAAGNIRA